LNGILGMFVKGILTQESCGGSSMKVSVVGTGRRKRIVQAEQKVSPTERTLTDQIAQVEESAPSRRTIAKQGLPRQRQKERAARVEALRAQVQAGTYEVDTQALAELLLTKAPQTLLNDLE
jgi:anti-sigma28 factor (negative regulator of flagellin synthesis)